MSGYFGTLFVPEAVQIFQNSRNGDRQKWNTWRKRLVLTSFAFCDQFVKIQQIQQEILGNHYNDLFLPVCQECTIINSEIFEHDSERAKHPKFSKSFHLWPTWVLLRPTNLVSMGKVLVNPFSFISSHLFHYFYAESLYANPNFDNVVGTLLQACSWAHANSIVVEHITLLSTMYDYRQQSLLTIFS